MGLLDMSRSEINLYMQFFTEAAKLRGQPCRLYQIDTIESDLHNDKLVKYKDPVKINILFEDNPKTILKKLNWFTEDEDLPYVAYLTSLDEDYTSIKVEKECLIETSSIQVDQMETSKFLISSIKGSSINPSFWICKLVPYRPKSEMAKVEDPEAPSNTDMGYSFIRRRE